MRKVFLFSAFIAAALLLTSAGFAQTEGNKTDKSDSLSSKMIEEYGQDLDKLIVDWSKRIESVIKKYELMNTKEIRILPYQTDYELGDGYIEIEKHFFIKDPAKRRSSFAFKDITGIKIKKVRIYSDGQTISKIETTVAEKYFTDRPQNEVIIVDPSPTAEGTDDITITHIYKGKTIIKDKKLGDIRNKTDFPIRNNIKLDFLLPNLTISYNSLMFIAEAYFTSLKDTDKFMSDFLKDSADLQ